jgi:hypothetical protein
MNETFDHNVCLLTAVGALFRGTVHERVMPADEGGAGTPVRRIVWDLA